MEWTKKRFNAQIVCKGVYMTVVELQVYYYDRGPFTVPGNADPERR